MFKDQAERESSSGMGDMEIPSEKPMRLSRDKGVLHDHCDLGEQEQASISEYSTYSEK